MRSPDLIDHLLEVTARTCGLDDDQVARIEARLRKDFGGDCIHYLAKVGRRQIERRNRRILIELSRGRPMREVAAELGVSVGTVAEVKKAAPCRPMQANVQPLG